MRGEFWGLGTGVIADMKTGWLANSDVFGGWGNSIPKRIAVIQEPANAVMLAENDNWPPRENASSGQQTAQAAVSPCRAALHAVYNTRWASETGASPTNDAGRIGGHHMAGANFTYADGHAKWLKEPPLDCHAWVPPFPPDKVFCGEVHAAQVDNLRVGATTKQVNWLSVINVRCL